MSGFLYPLESQALMSSGAYFPVNGPWGTHGYVIKSELKPNGLDLNLIRGTGKKKRAAV